MAGVCKRCLWDKEFLKESRNDVREYPLYAENPAEQILDKWTILGALQRLDFAITIDRGTILRLGVHTKRAEFSGSADQFPECRQGLTWVTGL